jgi:hypothetical protein
MHRVPTTSIFGAIAGHSRFADASDVASELKEDLDTRKNKLKGNIYVENGKKLEPVARDMYIEKNHHLNVEEVSMGIWKKNPYLGASPDGLVGDDGLLEIKCPARLPRPIFFYTQGYDVRVISDEIPVRYAHIWPHYYDQMQGCMAIFGRKWCDYVVYVPGMELFIDRVTFNEEYWNNILLPRLESFVNKHIKGQVPEYDEEIERIRKEAISDI